MKTSDLTNVEFGIDCFLLRIFWATYHFSVFRSEIKSELSNVSLSHQKFVESQTEEHNQELEKLKQTHQIDLQNLQTR